MSGKRILVIDDDGAVRAMLCDNLKDCGYEVLEAANGDDGLMRIKDQGPPDLVITDIIMPRKEGLETIREIRADYPHIKVIAISGGARTKVGDLMRLASTMGSHASMPKPLDMGFLEDTIRRLVG